MPEMKDSGIEWIGKIPTSWKLSRIGGVYAVRNQKVSDKDYIPLSVTKNGIVPQLESTAKTNAHDDRKLVKKGDFAINSRSDRRGSCGISNYDGSISLINTVLYPIVTMVPRYFDWLFHTIQFADEFYANGHGIVDDLWTTTWSEMKNIVIPVPSLGKQETVASYLDSKCSEIDTLRADIEEQIRLLEEYKKSVITEAVTKGLNPDVEMKDSGIEWIGNIPLDWNVYRIANLYDERSERGSEELPILTVSINTGVSDYEIADEDKDRIFIRSEDRTKYKRVYPGDLAYNMMRAWQGAFGAVRVNGMVSPAYVVAKPKKNVELDSRYMEALLRTSEAREEMHRYSRGIVDFRLRLYWPEFKNIRICLPPIKEQIEIADYIDEKSAAIDALISEKEKFAAELENYKKSLIYEYVTGKKEVPVDFAGGES